jgi:hypothetical protein
MREKYDRYGQKARGVNHWNNDLSTITQRQRDLHSHAIVLDLVNGMRGLHAGSGQGSYSRD